MQFSGLLDWDEDCVTLISRYIDSARPMTSNPGPMLADEHGIRMTCILRALDGFAPKT